MKAYKTLLQKPLTKNEVRLAVQVTISTGYADAVTISRKMQIGFGKANKLSKLMYAAGIIVDSTMRGTVVILKGEAQALNAAYRQLNKGRKGGH
ncbi:hypothetical protein [Polynucleobacter sp.]|jgi:hypothetical protein|uniref:hypothetical protein n=1 Tax=Polynucleobacter sp. TaxID=2029855 RepID=UPI003F69B58F